jgi:7-carboxy-7-deazaguanine synthase (Cx14CxxC type)
MYAVKEIFYTLQGEGANAGRAAVFCRFAGCNLWSGREADRETAACRFCDTDFVGTDGEGGGKFREADDLAAAVLAAWQGGPGDRFVVLTGGEPALQVDAALTDALHRHGFTVAIETNGTLPLPPGLDWICVSPKAGNELRQTRGDELKLVFPQDGLAPDSLLGLDFPRRFLSPMDGPDLAENTAAAVAYVKANPAWRLSVQTHKQIGIP